MRIERDDNNLPIPFDPFVWHAQQDIYNAYGDIVSVEAKKKDLLKFGRRTTVGTGWETLMTTVGTETAETYASGNNIDTIVSSTTDTVAVRIEYHTVDGSGNTTFGTQDVTLTGATPTSLTTPAYRVNRMYNLSTTTALAGNIYVYEDNTGRDDDKTHLVIAAGEQQSQKAATTISSNDYWIITSASISVLSKVTKYAEARLERKAVGSSVWLPITQTYGCTDTTGTIFAVDKPYIIVPANNDVRMAVKTNTSAVDVAGGFNGYLASVIQAA